MNQAQKAVLEAAKANGLSPMEQSAEFMLHDLVQACIDAMRQQTKVYNDLGEQQQDAVNATLQSTLKQTVITAAHILSGAEVIKVPMLLQDFKAGKDIKLTGSIDSDDPGRYQLMDMAHSKSRVLILLQEMPYFEGLSNIRADKDQKPLDLEGDSKPASGKPASKGKAAKPEKVIEVAPKMLIDAREFIILQQNPTVAGLQNYLHCDRTKAEHIHTLMQEEGVLTAKDASGMRQLIRSDAKKPARTIAHKDGQVITTTDGSDPREGLDDPQDWSDVLGDLDAQPDLNVPLTGEDTPIALTEELYEAIKATVIKRQSVSAGVLMVDHALPEETVLDAIDRLELDEVISTEDDMGGRQVLITPATA